MATVRCGDSQIPFVKSVKMLGVIIDDGLKFDGQIKNICKKVNSKTSLLARSSYLFPDSFKPILFKLFIQPHFDYCGTVFMHFSNKAILEKLDRCFVKSVLRLIKINLFGLDQSLQYAKLRHYNILPMRIRQFFHFCTFLFTLFKTNNIFLIFLLR